MKYFKLPDLGEGLAEAEIVEWHVAAGDTVAVDQKLVSVETAKAVVEVPSPVSAKVIQLFGQTGATVHIGAPLVEFETDSDESATVVGQITEATATAEEDHFIIGRSGAGSGAGTGIGQSGIRQSGIRQTSRALPSVRAAAKRAGIDLSSLKGTGESGQILLEDVERAIAVLDEKGKLEPLQGSRKTMAKAMSLAHSQVVPVTLSDDCDVHGWDSGQDLTMRLVHAIGVACQAEPALNAWFDGEQLTRRLLHQVDLGIAVDAEQGLFVPVLRDITHKDLVTLRAELNGLRQGIKDRNIAPSDLMGASISLSNFGMIAGRYASPIVVPPTVAIIGAGRIIDSPVAVAEQVEVHRLLPISLSFDHRAMTGGEAARFLKALLEDLSRPQVD